MCRICPACATPQTLFVDPEDCRSEKLPKEADVRQRHASPGKRNRCRMGITMSAMKGRKIPTMRHSIARPNQNASMRLGKPAISQDSLPKRSTFLPAG